MPTNFDNDIVIALQLDCSRHGVSCVYRMSREMVRFGRLVSVL